VSGDGLQPARPYLRPPGFFTKLLGALVALAFIRVLYGAEDLFEKIIPSHDYVRHVTGLLGVGFAMEVMRVPRGHYHLEGMDYECCAGRIDDCSPRMHRARYRAPRVARCAYRADVSNNLIAIGRHVTDRSERPKPATRSPSSLGASSETDPASGISAPPCRLEGEGRTR